MKIDGMKPMEVLELIKEEKIDYDFGNTKLSRLVSVFYDEYSSYVDLLNEQVFDVLEVELVLKSK